MLWRHGRTLWNRDGRFQGQTDIELDATGRSEADRAARLLAALGPAAIVSSDLRRAADTGQALARVTGLAVRFDPDLRETHGGIMQGLTTPEIRTKFGAQLDPWFAGDVHFRPDGGESRVEVAERTAAAIERAAAAVPDAGTLVVATHGGAARLAIGRLLELPPDTWLRLGVLSNCCWSLLSLDRHGWRLIEHNAGTLPEPVLTEEG